MRIISGAYRGKKIYEPKDLKTRPLKDLTKESIFNVLIHSKKFTLNFQETNVLDVFSGIGSFGIECLSRGVKNVVFIENYKGVLPILKKNLQNLKLVRNYEIIEEDVYSNILTKLNKKFDIIFLDPPYREKNLEIILLEIKNSELLNKNGIIVLHRHKKVNDFYPPDFKIIEEKIYGISKIIFLSFF